MCADWEYLAADDWRDFHWDADYDYEAYNF